MLKLENLNCGYGSVEAVHDVSFEVPAASVFALLGPNGAGKTSTIMAIMGHVDIHAGRIIIESEDITRRSPTDRVGLGISLVPEGRQLFSDLTVDENLTAGGYARPISRDAAKRERVFGLFPRLYERRSQMAASLSGGEQQMLAIARILRTGVRLLLLDEPTEGLAPVIVQRIGEVLKTLKERYAQRGGTLSGGEQQMLAIGRALMAEPRLLLVDELSLGLMPKMVDLCLDALLKLKREGMTIVLVEQNFRFASRIADRFYLMDHGQMVSEFPVGELPQRMDVLHKVLGV